MSITNHITRTLPSEPQSKIARVCWNTNRWVKPSGRKGKSIDKESYEYLNGVGHEEWLLDFSKIIDGYHYAFLQSINHSWDKFINEKAVFNISLYAINGETRKKWWIGELRNVEVINKTHSQDIAEKYKKRGWLKEMQNQVLEVGGKITENDSECAFNIKFSVEDATGILPEPKQLDSDDASIKSYYYSTLLNKKELPKFVDQKSIFTPGHKLQKNSYEVLYSNQAKDVNKLHSDIQTFCYNELVSEFGEDFVCTEHPTGYGASVDIAVKHGESLYYYEIKTNPILRECIRGAVAQLLEYAHYSQSDSNKVKKLTIISTHDLTLEAKNYLNILKSLYGIPLSYRKANLITHRLGEES